MPSKKQPTVPEWQVILEDIQSQNRATIEAVEAARLAVEQRIDRVDQDSRGRGAVLEMAIRHVGAEVGALTSVVQENSVDIRGLKAGIQEHSVEIRKLSGKVEAMVRIEERVTALEQRRD
jgi:hypothetical protein